MVPVNVFVPLGAPLGHTTPMSVNAMRSVDVLIGMPTPVAAAMRASVSAHAHSRLNHQHIQKIKYVPALSRHMVGSCTEMSPVTVPGFGYATAAAASSRSAPSLKVVDGAIGFCVRAAEHFVDGW